MAVFFNKTKGPLSFALPDGTAIVVSPKGRVVVEGDVPTSMEMKALLQRGVLMLLPDAPAKPAPPVVALPTPARAEPEVAVSTAPLNAPKESDSKGWNSRSKYKVDAKVARTPALDATSLAPVPALVAPDAVKVEATSVDTVAAPELGADSTDKSASAPSDAQ